ncbi:glycerophosphoryl diester phosphodiesterase [Halopelagius inordinatus]|uniref:Glycerophosphoryl diester phosphodiesterase n=1 Tax=Halopelagius inordinatus TaxID=553467 RepID=A0A1I2NPC7_9EURY|nr:glycerophosphodiester phosphodiesterase [Halopelagius inordinatus]SFG05764.1 glycerophosphoryl diester phosphodiesterase [Halopelagius inordinatus]
MSRDRLTLDRRSFVAGTGAAVGTVGLSGAASARGSDADDGKSHDDGHDDSPTIIAHRGFAGQYPENTVGAFERAAADGAEMIEVDIMLTADERVVVFHDDKLSSRDGGERGLTDMEGNLWDYTWEELKDAEVLESGETIPTLEQSLEAIPDDVGVNLEFKHPGETDLYFATKISEETLEEQKETWRPLTENALEIASDYDNDILVSSFYEAALAAVREEDPDVPIAFLFWDSIEEGLEITREYDCEAVHPPYNMVKGTPFFNDEYYVEADTFETDLDLVAEAHDEDRTVNTWTIGTWYQAEKLAAAGVDGLIADYPNLLWSESDDESTDD